MPILDNSHVTINNTLTSTSIPISTVVSDKNNRQLLLDSDNNENTNSLSCSIYENLNLKVFQDYLYNVFPYPMEINSDINDRSSISESMNDSQDNIINNILELSNFEVNDQVDSYIRENMIVKRRKEQNNMFNSDISRNLNSYHSYFDISSNSNTIDLTIPTEISDVTDFNEFTAPSALDALAALTTPKANKISSPTDIVSNLVTSTPITIIDNDNSVDFLVSSSSNRSHDFSEFTTNNDNNLFSSDDQFIFSGDISSLTISSPSSPRNTASPIIDNLKEINDTDFLEAFQLGKKKKNLDNFDFF
jgi:hypothetical protein